MDAGVSSLNSVSSSDDILSTERMEAMTHEEKKIHKFKGFSKNLRKLTNQKKMAKRNKEYVGPEGIRKTIVANRLTD